MYSDTKFKIIDTMKDRYLIHYIWSRLLTLAGKVNLDGDLYMSKSSAYTIETLALEFNRSAKNVELALKVFMDLEMIVLTKDNVYKIRNFAKHQNIKTKKKEHDIGNVIDEDKKIEREYNVNNKESIVNSDRQKSIFNIYSKREDVIHLDKESLFSKADDKKNISKSQKEQSGGNDIIST